MSTISLEPLTVVSLRQWSSSLGYRTLTRAQVEAVLIEHAFYDELIIETAYDLPESAQAVRVRLDRCTDALMALLERR